jgi:hypothetical protein
MSISIGRMARHAALLMLLLPALLHAEPRFRGEWQQGSVIRGQVEPGTRVWFRGVELQVSARGEFVFGLDRDEGAEIWLKTQAPGAEPASRTTRSSVSTACRRTRSSRRRRR